MRNYTQVWESEIDDQGHFLNGKIAFYDSDATTLKTIYDSTGVALTNPIYTDTYGKTSSQVLLQDSDYVIKYFRYTGSGVMAEDDDESNWLLYKTVVSKQGTYTIVNNNLTAINKVDTIADLKDLSISGLDNFTQIQLLGYYNKADKPSVYYEWVSGITVDDDAGRIVKSNNTELGRWKMILPSKNLDVRHYGVFPTSTKNIFTSYTSQLAFAAACANDFGLDLYFPQINGGGKSYYNMDGTNTCSINQDMYFADNVLLQAKSDTSGTAFRAANIYKATAGLIDRTAQSGKFVLSANELSTSWNGEDIDSAMGARFKYNVDTDDYSISANNSILNFQTTFTKDLWLTNERIDSYEKISANVFKVSACTLKENYFVPDYDYDNKIDNSGCFIDIHDWTSANTYIKLKNNQNDSEYNDLLYKEVVSATLLPSATVENCHGSLFLKGDTVIKNSTVDLSFYLGDNYIMHVSGTNIDDLSATQFYNIKISATSAGVNLYGTDINNSSCEKTALGDLFLQAESPSTMFISANTLITSGIEDLFVLVDSANSNFDISAANFTLSDLNLLQTSAEQLSATYVSAISLSAENCKINFTGDHIFNNLSLINTTFNDSGSNISADNVYADKSILNASALYVNDDFYIQNNSFVSAIVTTQNLSAFNSTVYNNIYQNYQTSTFSSYLVDDNFLNDSMCYIQRFDDSANSAIWQDVSAISAATVTARWIHNYATIKTTNFLQVDRTYLDPSDAAHDYAWGNNSGPGVIVNNAMVGPLYSSAYDLLTDSGTELSASYGYAYPYFGLGQTFTLSGFWFSRGWPYEGSNEDDATTFTNMQNTITNQYLKVYRIYDDYTSNVVVLRYGQSRPYQESEHLFLQLHNKALGI